jgi:hypothetical protein
MTNLISAVKQLEHERNRLSSQLERVNHALSVLGRMSSNRAGRTISDAGRARIAAAQRKRWAKARGEKVASTTGAKRTMSPAARKRIVAAQKARWAEWRKAHTKA